VFSSGIEIPLCTNDRMVVGLPIFQLYGGSQFYWWRKPDKTLSHNFLSITPRLSKV
jgi:hypothetical protein